MKRSGWSKSKKTLLRSILSMDSRPRRKSAQITSGSRLSRTSRVLPEGFADDRLGPSDFLAVRDTNRSCRGPMLSTESLSAEA